MKKFLLKRTDHDPNAGYITDFLPDTKLVNTSAEIAQDVEWVIRWGNRVRVPERAKVINRVSAMNRTINKGLFRKKVSDIGAAPRTYLSLEDYHRDRERPSVVVVRPQFHERSENIYLCKNLDDVDTAISRIGPDYYISEYINKTNEYRVFVANGRALIMVEKMVKDKKAVTWGCVEEGKFKYIRWSEWLLPVAKVAIEAFNLSKLDFGAIDVMTNGDKAYFLEVNTAPEIMSYYGEVMAMAFTYMMDGDKRGTIPVQNYEDWKNIIHPCLSENAIV